MKEKVGDKKAKACRKRVVLTPNKRKKGKNREKVPKRVLSADHATQSKRRPPPETMMSNLSIQSAHASTRKMLA